MAGVASAVKRSVYLANSSVQNALTDGSVMFSTTFLRYSLSAKTRLTDNKVASGYSKRASKVLVKIYSIRALQASTQILTNTLLKPDTTKWRLSTPTSSMTLKEIGKSKSNGAM